MNFKRGEKTPTPKISALLRKRPVLLRANFVLTKDRKRPYYGHFCGKMHREGSCSKAAGGSLVKSRCWILSWGWGSFRLFQSLEFLEDPNLLKLRSLDSSCPFFLSDKSSIWDNLFKCSKCYDRKAKISLTQISVIAKRSNRVQTPNAIIALELIRIA